MKNDDWGLRKKRCFCHQKLDIKVLYTLLFSHNKRTYQGGNLMHHQAIFERYIELCKEDLESNSRMLSLLRQDLMREGLGPTSAREPRGPRADKAGGFMHPVRGG